MMNDFTKEELETILRLVEDDLDEEDGYVYVTNYHDKLRDKIQSMLDNYCEHDESGGECEIFVDICSKCNAFILRDTHYE